MLLLNRLAPEDLYESETGVVRVVPSAFRAFQNASILVLSALYCEASVNSVVAELPSLKVLSAIVAGKLEVTEV